MRITPRPPIVMAEGSGSWLRDTEGREYLDFVQGWAVNCLGHGQPVVLEALQAQARRLINCSPAYHNEPMARLASLLAGSSGLDAVAAAITEGTAAVMVEPIQGEAGVIPARDDYLRALRALADERGVLLILDEIQTGIGRTGRLYAFEHVGVRPDILTLGKGLGGGVPLAALVASAGASCFEPGDQGGTFNGNPLMSAVGCAVMDTVRRPEFLAAVRDVGAYLEARLAALSAETGHGEVRGRGLLLALALTRGDAAKVAEGALDRGLLINAPRPDTLRFMPALTISREEVDEMIERLRPCLA